MFASVEHVDVWKQECEVAETNHWGLGSKDEGIVAT